MTEEERDGASSGPPQESTGDDGERRRAKRGDDEGPEAGGETPPERRPPSDRERDSGDRRPHGPTRGGSGGDRPGGDRPGRDRPRGDRPGGSRPYGDRPRGDRPGGSRPYGDRPRGDRPGGSRPYRDRPRGDRPGGDRPYSDRPYSDRPRGDRPGGSRPYGDRPRGDRPGGDRPYSDRPRGDRPNGGRPYGDRPGGDRPRGDRPSGDRPDRGRVPGGRRPGGDDRYAVPDGSTARVARPPQERPSVHSRVYFDLVTFVAERYPFLVDTIANEAARTITELGKSPDRSPGLIETYKEALGRRLERVLEPSAVRVGETTPGVSAAERFEAARDEILEAIDGQLERQRVAATFTDNERRELLRGMILTRAIDNRLKAFFTGGEVRYGSRSFQGKGFRSLGQEAIYGAALRLHRGPNFRREDGSWGGDVVAPMIRDLGVALGMRPDREIIRQVLSAQMGKAGLPMDGRDLHIGDLSWGILPAAAPLGISTASVAGMAMGFQLADQARVAFSFIGEGGSSLGEWHEAINLCAVRALPAVFCVQNNQTALATPLREQSAVRVFADKGIGYGIPAVTIDGTDPEAIAAAFSWAAERARSGDGPALLELVAMRMCGHAHHDDMLYLGKEPHASWDYATLSPGGYVNEKAYHFWAERDPIPTYATRLEALDTIEPGDLEKWKKEAEDLVEEIAREVIEAPWPDASRVGVGVFADGEPRRHREPFGPEIVGAAGSSMDAAAGTDAAEAASGVPALDPGPDFDPKGRTFLEAIQLGVGDALEADERVFVYGEDVGGRYGNAFLLLRPLLERHGDRILNSTLAEGGVLGVCVGAALAGRRPIGEMQFNDFVATGFNQLVNNAAKIRYRWGQSVPMVVRMPWGGLRNAGPYHSQNTEAWFYRTPGLKIVCPSTPHDARAFLATAVADPDPVLYYEHIGLYRDPRVRQLLPDEAPEPIPFGRAALRRAGDDLAIISYGAYVHVALRVAEALSREDGVEASVLDLRTLVPLDRGSLLGLARRCGRVLIVHEDSRTGGIGESLAAIVQEEAFTALDAPVRIVGALDTPVPYSPPLEEAYLPSEERILGAARKLLVY